LRVYNCRGWVASKETTMMLLELKMVSLLWLMYAHAGWGAAAVCDSCARGEWLGIIGGVLVG
jgi:hypothetical protein